MSEMAKKAREAMKSKAQRLGASRPLERVDAATWTPPELLNADVKTGLRPVSPRQFKKGGKVKGAAVVARADRKPRKSGGRAITADSLINRNVKEANESREGIKHVGGMKKGGKVARKKYATDGKVDEIGEFLKKDTTPAPKPAPKPPVDNTPDVTPEQERIMRERGNMNPSKARCYGGKTDKRTKKMAGGPMAGASSMMEKAKETAGVPSDVISSVPAQSRFSKTAGLKKGGKAEAHSDEAMDRALIKKMVKPSARTGKADGGPKYTPEQEAATLRDQGMALRKYGKSRDDKDDKGAKMMAALSAAKMRAGRKTGGRTGKAIGGAFGQYLSPALMLANAVRGDDDGKARGGRNKAKGKTNINIVIAAGKQPGQQSMGAMPADAPQAPAGLPVPVPPPQGGAPGGMPMPMPMPMPQGAAPAGAPAGGPPMPRKAGGRISKVAKSYKDMTAGAGSGEGRLQKTDIAKRGAHKAGGKVYRSYKDMDAALGSLGANVGRNQHLVIK